MCSSMCNPTWEYEAHENRVLTDLSTGGTDDYSKHNLSMIGLSSHSFRWEITLNSGGRTLRK